MFQLALDMPAPILAELLGTTDKNAANWTRLTARAEPANRPTRPTIALRRCCGGPSWIEAASP
jgi:hypothetical protein